MIHSYLAILLFLYTLPYCNKTINIRAEVSSIVIRTGCDSEEFGKTRSSPSNGQCITPDSSKGIWSVAESVYDCN